MKILCLSLLRLGDIIQHRWLLKGLRQRYPSAEIHMLVHDEFAEVAGLVPEAARVHFFPKTELQTHMSDPRSPLMWPQQRVNQLVQDLNREPWTLVYNFTHNRQSAYLMELIKADRKRGLRTQNGQMMGLDNSWLRFFNDHFSGRYPIYFHYLELLSKSLEISLPSLSTISYSQRRPVVCIQVDSADRKKAMDKKRMAAVIEALATRSQKFEYRVISDQRNLAENSSHFGPRVWVGTLRETAQQVQAARALISLDTSIKHLAAHYGTPLLEISLGSSDAPRTGAWLSGSRLVSGKAPCRPCPHRSPCSQQDHHCSLSLGEDHLVETIEAWLDHRESFAPAQCFEGPLGFQIETADQSKAYGMFKKWLYQVRIEGQDPVQSLGPQFKKICYGFTAKDLVKLAEELEAEYHGFLHLHQLAQSVALFGPNPDAYRMVDAKGFHEAVPQMMLTPWWVALKEKIESGGDWTEIDLAGESLLKTHLAVRTFLSKLDILGGMDVRSSGEKAHGYSEATRKA